ncbi:hypothetical protein [Paraburkholderia sp.]|uniref:hypothetical protein n=1 Tax=Paraburkholderia sp. TaxID=1926495 RepID=UPI003D6E2D69
MQFTIGRFDTLYAKHGSWFCMLQPGPSRTQTVSGLEWKWSIFRDINGAPDMNDAVAQGREDNATLALDAINTWLGDHPSV